MCLANQVSILSGEDHPSLEVRILGLSLEDEKAISDQRASDTRQVVGVWVDEGPFGSVITIYRKGESLYLERKFTDGSSLDEKMRETKVKGGTKLVKSGGNPHGEYYFLDDAGHLHAGGQNGLFKKFKK